MSCNLTLSTWPKRSALFCSESSVASCVKYQVIWYPDDISMCPAGELAQVTAVGLKTHRDHRLVSRTFDFRLVRNARFHGDRNSKKPRTIPKHLKRSSANFHENLPLVLTSFPKKTQIETGLKRVAPHCRRGCRTFRALGLRSDASHRSSKNLHLPTTPQGITAPPGCPDIPQTLTAEGPPSQPVPSWGCWSTPQNSSCSRQQLEKCENL